MFKFRHGNSGVSQLFRIGDMALLRRANSCSTRSYKHSPPTEGYGATCRRFKLSIAESIEEGLSAPMQQQVTKSGDKSPHSKLLP
jgi:hypothetical protein